jgi:hypothetical protein
MSPDERTCHVCYAFHSAIEKGLERSGDQNTKALNLSISEGQVISFHEGSRNREGPFDLPLEPWGLRGDF